MTTHCRIISIIIIIMKRQGFDRISMSMQPPKVAIIACFAVRGKALVEGLGRWFVYFSFPELFRSWLKRDQIGGRVGLPAVDSQWFGSGINRAGESLLNTFDHLGSFEQLPIFFQSATQFWGLLGVFEVCLAITNMFEVRYRHSYWNVLTMLVETFRHEGVPEHTLWACDEFNRRRYQHAVMMGIPVDPDDDVA